MCAQFVKQSQRITYTTYEHVFGWKDMPGAGFSFTCDAAGNVTEFLQELAQRNYQDCMNGKLAVIDLGVQTLTHTYIDPAVIICDVCGWEVILNDAFWSTCSHCGADYNGMGQHLAPREQWGEETGESLADMLNSRDEEEI